MESAVYNQTGKKVGSLALPASLFGVSFNRDLVHEVVRVLQANQRANTAHSKSRGEVRGGGKKPWQQKGTGRARHGSRRSPLWRGGGVTFGPRIERVFERKINKKAKAKALAMLLTAKYRDGEMLFLDSLEVKDGKTKNARAILKDLASVSGFESLLTKKKNAALVCVSQKNVSTARGFKNFGNILMRAAAAINPLDLATYKYIIVIDPKAVISVWEEKLANKHKVPHPTS